MREVNLMELIEYGKKMKLLPELLLPWYEKNKRDLPWRKTNDPYRIWISEIMLQQTRVETVIERYLQFISVLPTAADLAACNDDELMKLWEGLGYYSRAQNLKKAAQLIMSRYDGVFPGNSLGSEIIPRALFLLLHLENLCRQSTVTF